ncbi:MAG: hypothetical protein EA398_11880 [Deltaproteobacteria bacterium]|nr:MAG: hypothetical protein EA398_11880 [Deltaproteobacteria bacterium]
MSASHYCRRIQALYPVLTIGALLAVFGLSEFVGANAFLAVYLCKLILGLVLMFVASPLVTLLLLKTLGWSTREILFTGELCLRPGDQVRILAHREDHAALRQCFQVPVPGP